MKLLLTLLLVLSLTLVDAQSIVDFEEFDLPEESYLNGEDLSGDLAVAIFFLPNEFTQTMRAGQDGQYLTQPM